jgi:hypothetical protein
MRLCSRLLVATVAVLAGGAGLPLLAQSRTATRALTLQASFSSHSSLRVSSSLLSFDVADPRAEAQTSVEFSAAARTRLDGEVVLTVEAGGAFDAPAGASASALEVVYQQEGGGQGGTLSGQGPGIAGRWVGSGVRQGRVVFTLRGASASGRYTMPVRFVLSLP